MLGEQLTAVDLCLSKPLTNAKDLGLLERFPTLEALFARLAARESYQVAFGVKK